MKKLLLFLLPFGLFAQFNLAEIKIARDQYGVPHIYAPTDAQVAYGLAWAHAEDNFETLQLTLLAGKGMLAQHLGKEGAAVDYVWNLLRCRQVAIERQGDLSADFKKVVEGYIAGINAYAQQHTEEVLVKRAFPVSLTDYLASTVLSLCVISGADRQLKDILSGKVSKEDYPRGSNAFAFSSRKTTDGYTYLNNNSHQPLEGPVSWYEAHLVSEEGWNIVGGLFPGACTIFLGTNEFLGWAHTVNHNDKIDVYKLRMAGKNTYWYNGQKKNLDISKAKLKVKIGPIKLPISKKVYQSIYGPTLKTKHGTYSIRLGANQEIRAIEQWYRMNKARNFKDFYMAMEMVAIPGFNTVYADTEDNIFYVSNGKIPFRNPAYNWLGVVPGDTSATLWTDFHPFTDLPQYLNPSSAYLYNTNNTVFRATAEQDNLHPENFDPTMGYPMTNNNRSMRFKELVDQYDKVSYQDFKTIKYDAAYPSKEFYFPIDINVLSKLDAEEYPEVKDYIQMLQNWDRKGETDSREAALFAELVYRIGKKYENGDSLTADQLVNLLKQIKAAYGTKEIPTLGEYQKLVRGKRAEPLWGMPDVLRAMYSKPTDKGYREGMAGETYILLSRFKKGELPLLESVINYGASNRPESPHYDDQMSLFLNLQTKKMSLDKEEVLRTAKTIYSPR